MSISMLLYSSYNSDPDLQNYELHLLHVSSNMVVEMLNFKKIMYQFYVTWLLHIWRT